MSSIWEERLRAHPFFVRLDEAQALLDTVTCNDVEGARTLDRLRHVVGFLRASLDTTDAELLDPSMLGPADAAMANVVGYLTHYRDTADIGHITSANAHANDAVAASATWPVAGDPKLARARAVLREAEAASRSIVEAAESKAAELGQRVDALSSSAHTTHELQTQTAALIEEYRQAFQAQIEQIVATFTSDATEQKGRLDTAIATFQQQFSESQEARSRASEDDRRSIEQAAKEAIEKVTAEGERSRTTETRRAEDIVKQLNLKLEDAKKTVDAIGVAGLAEGFGQHAQDQKDNADALRWGAIGALFVSAGFGVYAVVSSHQHNVFNVGEFTAKFVVSVSIGLLGAYLIIQSAQHRERERLARQTSLELASIDSFLALFPDPDKVALKRELAPAWFGRPVEPITDDGGAKAASLLASELVKFLMSQNK